MKSLTLKSIAAAGLAVALGACASMTGGATRAMSYELAAIHAGLTQDQVRQIAGKPAYQGDNPRTSETLWTYEFTDEWGYASEFGVDFDKATGLVKETSTQRTY